MAECDDRIKQLTKKSNVLKNLDRVLIGGLIGGLLGGTPEAVLGAAAGAAVPQALRHFEGFLGGLAELPRPGEPSPSFPRAQFR